MSRLAAMFACVPREAPVIRRARSVRGAELDSHAIDRLFREHAAEVWRYVVHRTGDANAADEVLSDVFLACVRDWGRFESRGIPARHWLLRIASAKASDLFRRRAREQRAADRARFDAGRSVPVADAVEDEPAPWRRALALLSEAHQNVLVLHYLHGLSVEQVAQVERCRVGTVKSRLSRAREELRTALRDGERP